MKEPIIYIAITNHGFGHAVRGASVARMIKKLCPQAVLILATMAPRWLLDCYIESDFIHRTRSFDVGVIQSDSLKMDQAATLDQLRSIINKEKSLIASEVSFINQNRVSLILADIPPLVARIAKAAKVRCYMMSNFGWDFIYRPWGGEFMEIADWIRDCFSECDHLFRLPFHEAMSAFHSRITDVGLTGGDPRYSVAQLREQFNITKNQDQTILLSFGGLGLDNIPYHNLNAFSDWQFITFDQSAPDLDNLIKVSDHNLRPVDVMPLCGRIISKPGYSTFAEAIRVGIPIVSITRSGFAESELLLEGIQNYSYHQIISPEHFFGDSWTFLTEDPIRPKLEQLIDKNGNEAIARAILES